MSKSLPTTPEFSLPNEPELKFLEKEYFFLQTTIEDYNKQIWVIKALGITATGAAIYLTVQEKSGVVALIGCIIPLFFWILESQWKHFQHGFYPRVAEIESILENYGYSSPAIYTGWCRAFKRHPTPKHKGYLWDGLLNRSVFVSYVLQITFLLFLSAIASKVLESVCK